MAVAVATSPTSSARPWASPLIMGAQDLREHRAAAAGRTNIIVTPAARGISRTARSCDLETSKRAEHAQDIAKVGPGLRGNDRRRRRRSTGRQCRSPIDMYLTQVEAGVPTGTLYFRPLDFEQWKPGGEINVAPHPATVRHSASEFIAGTSSAPLIGRDALRLGIHPD